MEGENRKTRAIIYARVSTEKQAEKGHSIPAQVEKCQLYCEAREWDIVAIFEETKSGAKMDNRPKLSAAMKMIKDKKADVIVIWKLDRLSRSLKDFIRIIDSLGPHIVSITESIDMTTPAGRLAVNMLMSFAQYERENIAEKTKLGMERAKKEGKKIGRDRQISIELIREVKRLRIRGFTYKEIADKLGITERRIRYILEKYGK